MPLLSTPAGARLACTETGSGRPVVLVHGWSLSGAAFAPLAPALPGFRLVAPDLRGHGASEGDAFTLGALADDLVALVHHLELRGAVLVGWSLGAQVALAALPALRDRVAGLVLASATPRFLAGDGWAEGLPAQALEVLRVRVRRDARHAVARFRAGMLAPGERAPELEALPVPPAAPLLAGLDVLAATDLRPALPALDLPALVLHGDADPICPPGAGRALASALPRARHVELPGAGHAALLTAPAARAALAAFLAEAR